MRPNVPTVWAEADECGVVKLDVGPQALVISVKEVFSAPNPDGTVIWGRCKVFGVATKIQARHIATVTLEGGNEMHRNTDQHTGDSSQSWHLK